MRDAKVTLQQIVDLPPAAVQRTIAKAEAIAALARTDKKGAFSLRGLPLGEYELIVEDKRSVFRTPFVIPFLGEMPLRIDLAD